MPSDPYAVLRALLRAEAVRSIRRPHVKDPHQPEPREQRPPAPEERERG
ncbi:hypothetical protein ABZV31_25585 [Streptomyces sp. NPDC005202]